jgi:flagellar basal-body rod modification protein FlgD
MDALTATPPAFSAQTAAATPTERDSVISSDFETFLRMLTVQMENQDPLNPIESSEYAVQLATFSSVEQQVLTNDRLSELSTQIGLMNMGQMGAWLGKEARAAVPAHFDGATPITVVPTPEAEADRAVMVVRNDQGVEVDRFEIGLDGAPMQWDGLDDQDIAFPNGLYSFQVESYSDGAVLSTIPAEVYAVIKEAQNMAGDMMLLFEGGVQVSASAVTALRDRPLPSPTVI